MANGDDRSQVDALSQIAFPERLGDDRRSEIEGRSRVNPLALLLTALGDTASASGGRGTNFTGSAVDVGLQEKREDLAKFDQSRKDFLQNVLSERKEGRADERTERQLTAQDERQERQLTAQATEREKDRELEREKLVASRISARDEKANKAAEKKEEKQRKLFIPTLGQFALTEQDSKDTKTALDKGQQFREKVNEMISLRTKHGAETLNREAVARGKQLSKEVLLLYKDLAKLGVLSKSDEDIINAIVPDDPLDFSIAQLAGADPVMKQLKGLKGDIDRDETNFLKSRGFDPQRRAKPAPNGALTIRNKETGEIFRWDGFQYKQVNNGGRV